MTGRSLRRWFVAGAVVGGALVVLIAGAGAWLLRTDAGRSALAGFIVDAAGVPGERVLTIGSIAGALPGEIVLRDVTVADRDGVWLTLVSARLVWQPFALLGRHLDIEALTVEGLDVARAPAGDAMVSEAPPLPREIALPPLPVDIRLARFDFERVTLGAGLLGEAAALRASGRFGVDALGDARGRVRVERIDGVALEAALDAELNTSIGTLTFNLRLAEPAGGLVARLAGLPDLPAVSLSLQGSGPAGAWQGRLAAEAEKLATLKADVAVALGERPTLDAVGSADIGGLAGADLLALLGPSPQFEVRIARSGPAAFAIEGARISGLAAEATARGSLDVAASAVDLTLAARLQDAAMLGRIVDGVEAGDGRVDIVLQGPTRALTVAATAELGGLAAAGIGVARLSAGIDGVLRPDGFAGAVRAGLAGIAGDYAARAGLPSRLDATAHVALDLAGRTVAVSDVSVTGDGVGATGSGRLDFAGGGIALDAAVTLDRLAPLAAFAGVALDGRMTAQVALTGSGFGAGTGGSLDIRLDDLASTTLPLAPTLGRSATLTATLGGVSADGIEVPDFTIAGANLRAGGRLAIRDGWRSVDLAATFDRHRLAPWQAMAGVPLAGTLRGTLAIAGALADPRARANLDLAGVAVDGVGPLTGRIEIAAATLVTAPAGTLAAVLDGPAGPLAVETRFARIGGDRLAFDDIAVTAAGARIDGRVALGLGDGLADGSLTLAAGDLVPLGRLAGLPLAGSATGRITLAPRSGDQTAMLHLTAPRLMLAGQPGRAPDLVLADLVATARLDGLAPQPRLAAMLDIGSLRRGDLALDRVALTADGTPANLAFTAKAAGTLPAPLTLELAGTAGRQGETLTVRLERLDGALAGTPLALRRPVTATAAPAALAVSPFELAIGDGRLTGSATLDARTVAARLDAAALPLGLLAALAPGSPAMAGALGLQVALDGDPADPAGSLTLRLDGVAPRDGAGAGSVTLGGTATAQLAAGRLAAQAEIGGFAGRNLVLDATLPLRLSLAPFAVSLPPGGAIAGTLDWQGEVAALWEALPFDGHRVAGRADIAMRAGGTVGSPRVTGHARLADGRYENLAFGTVLDRLTVDAGIDGARRLTVSLAATDGAAGTLTGRGSVAFDPPADFPVTFDLDFADATLVRRDELTLAAGGALSLVGDAAAMALTGRVETTRVEARLDTALPPSVVELGVVDRLPESQAAAPAAETSTLSLDLDIAVPGQAFVRGRGLDSEWRGTLRVTGDAAAPALAGTLSFVRGQFTFAGKRFTLDDSTIAFDGTPQVDPLLDIRAAHAADGVTARILITGRASDPKIALSSTPALPQDEVLSRVLFGKGAGALSPLEGLQLAAAVAQLSGQGPSGAGILDRVRETLGVDVLEVGAGASGEGASLRAGRYIDDRTFVGVTQGTQPGTTGVTVEIELLPNIVVDSQLDQAGTNKSGIKWKWDY